VKATSQEKKRFLVMHVRSFSELVIADMYASNPEMHIESLEKQFAAVLYALSAADVL
jgi:hypothetical protein